MEEEVLALQMLGTQLEVLTKLLYSQATSSISETDDIFSLYLGGGGRSAVQIVSGRDSVTAGGGGGGADCLKTRGCGGGGDECTVAHDFDLHRADG